MFVPDLCTFFLSPLAVGSKDLKRKSSKSAKEDGTPLILWAAWKDQFTFVWIEGDLVCFFKKHSKARQHWTLHFKVSLALVNEASDKGRGLLFSAQSQVVVWFSPLQISSTLSSMIATWSLYFDCTLMCWWDLGFITPSRDLFNLTECDRVHGGQNTGFGLPSSFLKGRAGSLSFGYLMLL